MVHAPDSLSIHRERVSDTSFSLLAYWVGERGESLAQCTYVYLAYWDLSLSVCGSYVRTFSVCGSYLLTNEHTRPSEDELLTGFAIFTLLTRSSLI